MDGAALEVLRLTELAAVYRAYEQELARRGALDFGEQIAAVTKLFKTRPNVLRRWQRQFRYMLIDEFQDANIAQIELIELLGRTPDRPDNVMVVGDDDQSIYRFRGASFAAFAEFDDAVRPAADPRPDRDPPGPPPRLRIEQNFRRPPRPDRREPAHRRTTRPDSSPTSASGRIGPTATDAVRGGRIRDRARRGPGPAGLRRGHEPPGAPTRTAEHRAMEHPGGDEPLGRFHLVSTCLPALRSAGGLVILVGSVSGAWPDIPGPAYQAAKAGLVGFARAAGLEERDNGVRFSVVAPGVVDTPLLDRRPQPPSREDRERMLQADDVAHLIGVLAQLPARVNVPELTVLPSALQVLGGTF